MSCVEREVANGLPHVEDGVWWQRNHVGYCPHEGISRLSGRPWIGGVGGLIDQIVAMMDRLWPRDKMKQPASLPEQSPSCQQ